MLSLSVYAVTVLVQAVSAQDSTDYIIYSSAVFSRTGRRTPLVNGSEDATTLTNTGAVQSYIAGSSLRGRYISGLAAFDSTTPNPLQFYALASDNGDYSAQSAEAFMQGLFPPADITSSNASSLDPTNVLWNGSYIGAPNGNTQYLRIHTAGPNDPASIYLDGATYCPNWIDAYNTYQFSIENGTVPSASSLNTLYSQVGQALGNAEFPSEVYNPSNAFLIYDYLDYQFQYDKSFHTALTTGALAANNANNRLRYESDSFMYSTYMAGNSPKTSGGSIQTIAGYGLASVILESLEANIGSFGELFKLSLYFGDFPPLMSLLALLDLPQYAPEQFTGLAEFGSLAVFELIAPSTANMTNVTSSIDGSVLSYPASLADLSVRFAFSNGTNTNGSTLVLTEWPMFPSSSSSSSNSQSLIIPWAEFQELMSGISISDVGEWCTVCDAMDSSVFCAAYDVNKPGSTGAGLHPAVAGVVGALVTLVVVGLALLFAVFVLGLGLSRKKAPLWVVRKQGVTGALGGGFKGSAKLASDADLTIAKNGAAVGVAGVGNEKQRVESWELREAETNRCTFRTGSVDEIQGVHTDHAAPTFVDEQQAGIQAGGGQASAPTDEHHQPQYHARGSPGLHSAISSLRPSFDDSAEHPDPFHFTAAIPHERV